MKIAVTSKGRDLDSQVDPRFGRAPYIIIVDPSSLEFEVIDNAANVNAFKGAGIQTAAMVSDKGAAALLTGYCGPNAFRTLSAGGVKVCNDVTGTVKDAVEAFNEGRVSFSDRANAEGHW
ncbi:Dinitrogenase iron-molybdenum cofactor domain-containing protein [Desulfonema limicola]|uniref:Dinitrogenase iron-molybdenum cofactor domain-containing protein n=1 Tax=Desulfonema limicola TaxID=45656 RepID=A0A975GJC6_9BACT|nr:NifB/NifX family molybdenum-iron cluster-binding protein [Desulfonema limicola]QTA82918.1 Dinitrogenase iron-molybdenum cofactor domain-containing protein [Desulfonema limicola]